MLENRADIESPSHDFQLAINAGSGKHATPHLGDSFRSHACVGQRGKVGAKGGRLGGDPTSAEAFWGRVRIFLTLAGFLRTLRRNVDETAFERVLGTLPAGAMEFWRV